MILASLNELSIENSFENEYVVNEKFRLLTQLIASTKGKLNSKVKIRIHEDFYQKELYRNRKFANWLSDFKKFPEFRDIKSYILTLLDTPLIKDSQSKLGDEFYGMEFYFEDRKSIGLAFAFVNDTFTFSLDTSEKWKEKIKVRCQKLEDTDTTEKVRNLTKQNHLVSHEQWFNDIKYRSSFVSIEDFISKKEKIFKNLLFCKSTYNDLKNIKVNTPEFNQIYNKLKDLDIAAEN